MLIKENLKGFEKALNIWNESRQAVRIYLDISTGDLMCFQYENLNSWEVFDSESVREIMARNSVVLLKEPFDYILDDEEFLKAINFSLRLTNTDDYILKKYVKENKGLKEKEIEDLEVLFLRKE